MSISIIIKMHSAEYQAERKNEKRTGILKIILMPNNGFESAKLHLVNTGTEIIKILETLYVQDKNGSNRNRELIWNIIKITWDSAHQLDRYANNAAEGTSISAIVLGCFQAISDQLQKYHYNSGESPGESIPVHENFGRRVQDAEFMQQLRREQWQIHFRLGGILEVCATSYMTEEERNGIIRKPH